MICGSKGINSMKMLEAAVGDSGWEPTEFISGGAKGVDTLAEDFARARNLPVIVFKPDWARYRGGAGYRRNTEMVDACDVVVAVWNGSSGVREILLNMQERKTSWFK